MFEQVFSLKNGLELVISILAIGQVALIFNQRKRSAVTLVQAFFFAVLATHFIALNINNYFELRFTILSTCLLFLYGPLCWFLGFLLQQQKYDSWRRHLLLIVLGSILLAFVVIMIPFRVQGFLIHAYVMLWCGLGIYTASRKSTTEVPKQIKSWYFQFAGIFFLINLGYVMILLFASEIGTTYLMVKIPFVVVFILFIVNNMRYYLNNPNFFFAPPTDVKRTEHLDQILTTIRKAVVDLELFLKSELTIRNLSEATSISERNISEAINSRLGKNFSQFINEFRLKRAVQLMENDMDSKRLIKEIMYESGFSNKVSFGAAFKNAFGCSPSEYRTRLSNRD